MAKIKSTLDIQLDLTRPVEDLTEVISAVIASQPARRKEILTGLDIALGSALAEIQVQEEKKIRKQMMIAQEKFPERRDGGRRLDKWEIFKFSAALGSSAVTCLYGGWSGVLGGLLALVIIDYVTGLFAAGAEGKKGTGPGLKSKIGLIGIARKVFIFAMVAVSHLIDGVLGDSHLFRDAVAYFYMANELLSILENGGRLGAPIPPVTRQAVEVLKSKSEIRKGRVRMQARKKSNA